MSGITKSDSSWHQRDFNKVLALTTATIWLGLYASKIWHHNLSWKAQPKINITEVLLFMHLKTYLSPFRFITNGKQFKHHQSHIFHICTTCTLLERHNHIVQAPSISHHYHCAHIFNITHSTSLSCITPLRNLYSNLPFPQIEYLGLHLNIHSFVQC